MDLEAVKRTATAAAYKGGEILRSYRGRMVDVRKKGLKDLVTEADTACEKALIETIRSRFPDHAVLAEESGATPGDESSRWIIDPLDGTVNFAHRLPFFCISIAFAYQGKTVMGLVFDPLSTELFSAVDGQGTVLNDHPIRVSWTTDIGDSLLATGFPYDVLTAFESVTRRFSNCLRQAQGIRRLGSAAMDLCYVACGRLEGFWEQNLKPWDTAAGVLIASEAGAVVTDFSNKPYALSDKELLATNGNIHQDMISLLDLKEPE